MKMAIKLIAFDAYGTLFDVHSVNDTIEKLYGEKGKDFSETWRTKQLDYAFLRQVMGRYDQFWNITKEALHYAAEAIAVEVSDEEETQLLEAYLNLRPYEEVQDVLNSLGAYQRVIFSNGDDQMLQPLVKNTGIIDSLDGAESVDPIKQFKPAPAAYQYLMEKYAVKREEVLFLSSNPWDIAGAKSFGFQTMWVNRDGKAFDHLGVVPDKMVTDLHGLSKFLKNNE